MKKILAVLVVFSCLAYLSVPALAGVNNGAKKYNWNLSKDVMPVPPYGSMDILGSDTSSKLIVNEPNGKVKANVTGVMNGLTPNTTYTVYLSNTYEKYKPATVATNWIWSVLGTYNHDINITQVNPDGTFSGTGGYPAGAAAYDTEEVITGSIVGNTVTLTTVYSGPYNPGYTVTAIGTIQPDGSVLGSTPWSWTAPAHTFIPASGSAGWPGLLNGVDTFTFTTDSLGSGSWHYNFKNSAPKYFSVWINGAGGTILISDPVTLSN